MGGGDGDRPAQGLPGPRRARRGLWRGTKTRQGDGGGPASRSARQPDEGGDLDLALRILAARRAITSLRDAARAGLAADGNTASRIRRAAEDLVPLLDDAGHSAWSWRPRSREPARVRRISVCSFDEAHAIADGVRRGEPFIVDLAAASDEEARRLRDFTAGVVAVCHVRVERAGFRQILLLPAEQASQEVNGSGPGLDLNLTVALDEIADRAAQIAYALQAGDGPLTGRAIEHARELASRLCPDCLPVSLAGVDLTGVYLAGTELGGAVWTSRTTWPGEAVAARMREISAEVSPGIYRVTGQQPACGS